jgi:hypothetical protein
MIGLEVIVNGKPLFVASLPEGVVSATVATVQKRSARRPTRPNTRAHGSAILAVTGYVETPTGYEHPWWVPPKAAPKLRVGDSVTVRVVNTSRPDKPVARHRQPKRTLEYFERRELTRLLRKHGRQLRHEA